MPVGFRIVVLPSIQRGGKYHASRLIETATPHIFRWIVVELVSVLPLDLVRTLIVAVLQRDLRRRVRVLVLAPMVYQAHLLQGSLMVLDARQRDLRRDQSSTIDALVVLAHKLVLLLGDVVADGLVVGVVARFGVYGLLYAVNMALD